MVFVYGEKRPTCSQAQFTKALDKGIVSSVTIEGKMLSANGTVNITIEDGDTYANVTSDVSKTEEELEDADVIYVRRCS